MPRQVTAKQLSRAQKNVGSTTGATYNKTYVPGCKRTGGANQNVQNLKDSRNLFADKGILGVASLDNSPKDDAMDILSSLGVGVIQDVMVQPNPRSPDMNKSKIQADFSLLKVETDMTRIPNAKIFDKKSQDIKLTSTKFVRIDEMYLSPSKISGGVSNIFKPDDRMTDFERGHKIRNEKVSKKNVVKLTNEIIKQQKMISTRIMDPQFKIIMNKQGI